MEYNMDYKDVYRVVEFVYGLYKKRKFIDPFIYDPDPRIEPPFPPKDEDVIIQIGKTIEDLLD